ncbi:hypothetical protein ACSMX9_11150 [Streptomyces sp. LE64]
MNKSREAPADAIRAHDLRVVRGSRTVLHDLAFTVPRGRTP